MRLFEFGKGDVITNGNDYPVLYHLCEYTSFSFAIENDILKSHSSYVSTTWDNTMNSVVGKPHAVFKFVLNGKALINQYSAFHYDDSAIEIGRARRTRVSHNEREIGIDTPIIQPLHSYHLGTVLNFNLFSESGIQWLLYKNTGQRKGFMSQEITATQQAIQTIYDHIFKLRKPIWKGGVGKNLTAEERAILKEIYRISKFNWSFTKSLEHLAGSFDIVDHWNKQTDRETYLRRHMAPKMVELLNNYYAERRVKEVDVATVKRIIEKCIDMMQLGNNAETIIKSALTDSGLYHPTTAAVEWGGILTSMMDGDVEETLDKIDFFVKRDRAKRDHWDKNLNDDMSRYSIHYGTSFGRHVER